MTLKAVAVCKAFEYCDRRELEIRSYFLSPLPKPRPYERTAYAARMTIRNTQSPIIALSPRSHFAATRESLVLVSPPRVPEARQYQQRSRPRASQDNAPLDAAILASFLTVLPSPRPGNGEVIRRHHRRGRPSPTHRSSSERWQLGPAGPSTSNINIVFSSAAAYIFTIRKFIFLLAVYFVTTVDVPQSLSER